MRHNILLVQLLVLAACLACTVVHAGEPDSFLGPQPVDVGSESLSPRDFRLARAQGTDWTDLLLKGYLTNAQLGQWSADFVSRCSSIARRFSIGKSVNGVDLWVVEISSHPGVVEAKPNFKYVANMHGNEPSGRMLLPMLAEWLCANKADPRASRIINNMHMFVMPTMNPDGFAANARANAAGVDLNRNFPHPFSPPCLGKEPETCPPSALSTPTSATAPETRAIMSWSLNPDWPFHFSANMHEGAVCANYPWDGYDNADTRTLGVPNYAPDQAAFVYLSKNYSMSHTFMSASREFKDGITNGAGWYPLYGGMQDWDYVAAGCMEITLELNQQKRPPVTQLPKIWNENFNALLNLPVAAVLGGIQGTITTSAGEPLKGAQITVAGNTMPAVATGPTAYYNKPSAPGTYTLTASAPGYASQTVTVTVPSSGAGVVKNFVLSRA